MEKVIVKVSWTENNYSAVCDSVNGLVIDTHKDFDKLKESFRKGFEFHIKSSIEDGDKLPNYIINGNYELDFQLSPSVK